MARSPHKKVHAVCPYGADTWAACDKAVNDAYADWGAMQQVILAYNIASSGRRLKENNVFGQLVDYIGGHVKDIMNDDGNPHRGAWVMRLRDAIERFKAGDLPVYNLYEPVAPAEGG